MTKRRKRIVIGVLSAIVFLTVYVVVYQGVSTEVMPFITERRMPIALVARAYVPAAWLESRFTGQTVFLTVPPKDEGRPRQLIYSAGPLVEPHLIRRD